MTTARDVIIDALEEINVLAAGESPSSEDATKALRALNSMVSAWELEGIAIGAQAWTLSSTINLPQNHMEALWKNLAVRLAPAFGAQVSNITVQLAGDGFRNLQTAYGEPIDMSVDGALTYPRRFGSGRPI